MSTPHSASPATDSTQDGVPLSSLKSGACGTVRCRLMDEHDQELLAAMGLADQCRLRVCRAGATCIVQVASTRLGLSADLARKILVRVEGTAINSPVTA